MSRSTLPATASATAVLATGVLLVSTQPLGPLSSHMALHIALMNVVAPLAAALLSRRHFAGDPHGAAPWAAATLQIALLLMWHAPSLQRAAMQSHALQVVMHTSLFLIALWFWWALLRLRSAARWQAVAILLLTGKLACLLAALLIFSPRVLYDFAAAGGIASHHGMSISLEDQQLAGLLMVIACPLSYLVAGVVFVAQAISIFEGTSEASRRPALPAIR